jgi:hypothetical protein
MSERSPLDPSQADRRASKEVAHLTGRAELFDLLIFACLSVLALALAVCAALIASTKDFGEIDRLLAWAGIFAMLGGIALVVRGALRVAIWREQRRVLAVGVVDSMTYLSQFAGVLYVLPQDVPLVMDSPLGQYFRKYASPLVDPDEAERIPSMFELSLESLADDDLLMAQAWLERHDGFDLAREVREARILRERVTELSTDALDTLQRVGLSRARLSGGSSPWSRQDG